MASRKSNQQDAAQMAEAILDVVISHLQDPANMSVEELFRKASYCETKRREVVAKLEGPEALKNKRSERKLLKEHFTWMVAGHACETELTKRNAGVHQTREQAANRRPGDAL